MNLNRVIGGCLLAIGVAIIADAKITQFVAHPEWTEVQALRNLWWYWLAGAASLALGAIAVNARRR